jgi:hypothetical protein
MQEYRADMLAASPDALLLAAGGVLVLVSIVGKSEAELTAAGAGGYQSFVWG